MRQDRSAILVSSVPIGPHDMVPLGLMAVATALAERHGIRSSIVPLPSGEDPLPGIEGILERATSPTPLFIGLSTMCHTLPRTLFVARALKSRLPFVPIVLGGPQATLAAASILDAYRFVDVIVLGEVEAVIDDLAASLDVAAPTDRPGLIFQTSSPEERPSRVPSMAPPLPLDSLPDVDYGLHAGLGSVSAIALDAGRGCPFSCTFCSTKSFFQRRFRIRSPEALVRRMQTLWEATGVRCFDLVHDMLTSNRSAVVELCERLQRAKCDLSWRCSARTDCVDEELLAMMFAAGCTDIYLGVETGSQRLQSATRKNLELEDAKRKIYAARSSGIQVTVSFIIGFPDETEVDLIDTVNMVLELGATRPSLRVVQVHLLAPLAGTEVLRNAPLLLYDGYASDLSFVTHLLPWEVEQIRAHPDIFSSYYYVENPSVSRTTYRALHRLLGLTAQYDEFFYLFWVRLGRDGGRAFVRWASTDSDALRALQSTDLSEPDVALEMSAMRALVEYACPDIEVRAELADALAFGRWKHQAGGPGEGPGLFISRYDYLRLDRAAEVRNGAPERCYAYALDRRDNRLSRLSVPASVLAYCSD